MKKLFLIFLLSSISFTSCNSEKKINVSETPIKTNILEIEIGQEIYIDCSYKLWMEPCFLAGGYVFTPSFEQINTNTVLYRCRSKYNDGFYCGGFKWHFLEIVTIKNNIVMDIALSGSYDTIEEAKVQYENILKKLSQIYGKGNIIQNGMMWTDMINYISLTYFKSECKNGSIRGFCYLRYRNIELESEMSKELNNEL